MSSTIAGHGLAVAPPRGWDVRIYRRPPGPGETTHVVLHAGTFALPGVRGEYGDVAVQLMSPSDVFVALCEFHPSSAGTALFAARGFPPPLVAGDLSRTSLQHAVYGHAGVQRFFTAAGRAWCLYVVVGSFDDRRRLVDRANELVAALEVKAVRP